MAAVIISSASELAGTLHKESGRQSLLQANKIVLSTIQDDVQLTGAYVVAPVAQNPLVVTDHAVVATWRQLTRHFADFFPASNALEHLLVHCTAQRLISLNSSNASDTTSGEAKDEELMSLASKTYIKHLTLSGQCWKESYWPWLNITETITVRGCHHTFNEELFARLTHLPGQPHTLHLHCLGHAAYHHVTVWMQWLAYIQRSRHFVGMADHIAAGKDPHDYPQQGSRHFKLVIFTIQLSERLSERVCRDLEECWAQFMPIEYTQGTRFVIDTYPEVKDEHIRGPERTKTIASIERSLFSTGQSQWYSQASSRTASGSSTRSSDSNSSMPSLCSDDASSTDETFSKSRTASGSSARSYSSDSSTGSFGYHKSVTYEPHTESRDVSSSFTGPLEYDGSVLVINEPYTKQKPGDARSTIPGLSQRSSQNPSRAASGSTQDPSRTASGSTQDPSRTASGSSQDPSRIFSGSSTRSSGCNDSGVVINEQRTQHKLDYIRPRTPDSCKMAPCADDAASSIRVPVGPVKLGDCGCQGWCNEANDYDYHRIYTPWHWLRSRVFGGGENFEFLDSSGETSEQEEAIHHEVDIWDDLNRVLFPV
ncbi:unnamed protein product [Sympodiomycopsis kandeliae]